MDKNVWLLDTTWPKGDIDDRRKRFPGLKGLLTKREMERHLKKWVKGKGELKGDDFVFIHQSDVAELIEEVEALRARHPHIRLYSGAATHTSNATMPRSTVQRQLDDFLAYWASGDSRSALALLEAPEFIIDRIRRWTDRFHHDYINLVAPIDLLSVAFAAGEIEEQRFIELHGELLDLLRDKQQSLISARGSELGSLRGVIDELIDVVTYDYRANKGAPETLPPSSRLRSALPIKVLHVDDEIANGWNLLMPELIPGYTYEQDPAEVLARIHCLEQMEEPYLVLLDLGLQSGDSPTPRAWRGLDVLREIRKDYPHTPVHIFSARNDAETYREATEAGADGFIVKPCRVLAEKSDYDLYERFRRQLTRARYDVFRAFTCRAIKKIRNHLANGEIPTLTERSGNAGPNRIIRQQNIDLALSALLDTDMERVARDRGYADIALRHLMIALYRPIEPRDDPNRQDTTRPNGHWKTQVLKRFRNMSAHYGRSRELLHLDIRDLGIATELLLSSEVLNASVDEARRLLSTAHQQIFQPAESRRIANQFWEVRDGGDRRLHPHLRHIWNSLPRKSSDTLETEDLPLYALLADRLRNPDFLDSELMVRGDASLADRPGGAYQGPRRPCLPAAKTDRQSQPIEKRPQTVSTGKDRWVKPLDYFIREQDGRRFIIFGTKWRGTEVDGTDPAQRDFFAWYYDKNVRGQEERYSDDALAFMRDTYGVGAPTPPPTEASSMPSGQPTQTERRTDASSDSDQIKTTEDFSIALYRVNGPPTGDIVASALQSLKETLGRTDSNDPFNRRNTLFFSEVTDRTGERHLRGVELRLRASRQPSEQYLQIRAVQTSADGASDLMMPLPYEEAWALVSKAAESVNWIDPVMLPASALPAHDQMTLAASAQPQQLHSRLPSLLKGLRVAVVSAGHAPGEDLASDWRHCLGKKYGLSITPAEQANTVLVVVPEQSPEQTMRDVYAQWGTSGKPWKVVSPSPIYKDWNVIVGLASRLGYQHDLPTGIRRREPNLLFIGLDLGRRSATSSQLAATLVNAKGHLIAWTKAGNAATERIQFETFSNVLSKLMPTALEWSDPGQLRLVIHRDGKALEPVDEYLAWLVDAHEIDRVDWIDIDKRRAPMFAVRDREQTGHYAEFVDSGGHSEIWLRTAPEKSAYARPICLIPQQTITDIETLALEVFDLSYALAQDYEMKNRLPLTTYLADGLSASGEKAVRFWGYEHLRL